MDYASIPTLPSFSSLDVNPGSACPSAFRPFAATRRFPPELTALLARQPQPDYTPNRLEDDRQVDLGTAQIPVPENNRRLANRIPLQPVQPVRSLDLEQVPVGKQPVQAHSGEGVPPPGLVSAGRVRVGHASDYPRVQARALAEHQPLEVPVDHADAVQVPRPQHQVVLLKHLGHR